MKDSWYGMDVKVFIELVSNYGFDLILKEPIIKENDKNVDFFYVYWHNELGVLLKFDTYYGSLNGGSYYYNWLTKLNSYSKSTSSGGFYKKNRNLVYFDENLNILNVEEYIGFNLTDDQEIHNMFINNNYYGLWIGEHDCRENIISCIENLKNNGKLLSSWINPYLSLYLAANYEYNLKNNMHAETSLRRLKILPENIKNKICYKEIIKQHQWK